MGIKWKHWLELRQANPLDKDTIKYRNIETNKMLDSKSTNTMLDYKSVIFEHWGNLCNISISLF